LKPEVSVTHGADVADRIVLRAMHRDAGLDEELARRLTGFVLSSVADGVDPGDAPELARRILAADPEASASTASVVSAAAADVLSGAED
jgi:hypothetical protein